MAEPTSRIERANSFREPEAQPQRPRTKAKVRPKSAQDETADQGAADAEEQEKHELDTLA
jgi:hypothetical protein